MSNDEGKPKKKDYPSVTDHLSKEHIQEYLDFAIQLAKEAGAIIKTAVDSRMSGTGSHIELKKENPTDLVTETDKAVEEFIKDRLVKTYPEHKYVKSSNKRFDCVFDPHHLNRFIGEETFASGAKTEFTNLPTWIVDPIGKTNIFPTYPL